MAIVHLLVRRDVGPVTNMERLCGTPGSYKRHKETVNTKKVNCLKCCKRLHAIPCPTHRFTIRTKLTVISEPVPDWGEE